jgi:hypothetical protein
LFIYISQFPSTTPYPTPKRTLEQQKKKTQFHAGRWKSWRTGSILKAKITLEEYVQFEEWFLHPEKLFPMKNYLPSRKLILCEHISRYRGILLKSSLKGHTVRTIMK